MSGTTETTPILQSTVHTIIDSAEFRSVLDQIRRGARVISISGLVAGPARALALAALQRETGKQFALVVAAQRDLENWERDISFWSLRFAGRILMMTTLGRCCIVRSDPYAGLSPHAES